MTQTFQNVKIQPFTGFNEENLLQEQLDGTISWLLSTDQYLKVRRNSYTKHHRTQYLNIEIKGFFFKINHTATTGINYKYIIYLHIFVIAQSLKNKQFGSQHNCTQQKNPLSLDRLLLKKGQRISAPCQWIRPLHVRPVALRTAKERRNGVLVDGSWEPKGDPPMPYDRGLLTNGFPSKPAFFGSPNSRPLRFP